MRQHHCPFLSCCKLLITWVSSDVPFPYACLYIIRNSNKLQSKSVRQLKCIHHNVASQVDRNIKLFENNFKLWSSFRDKNRIILSNYIDTPIIFVKFIWYLLCYIFLQRHTILCVSWIIEMVNVRINEILMSKKKVYNFKFSCNFF